MMMDWQPIETAPKDGTALDIWADGKRFTDAFWGKRSADKVQRDHGGFEEFGWCVDGDDGWTWPVLGSTHWMQIPEPPKADASQEAA